MKYRPFGISNIAWPAEALEEALAMLPGIGCTAVEIAPFNVFGRWDDIAGDASRLRDRIEAHGLVCSALQGILYGVPEVALFTSEAGRSRLLRHLESVAALAGLLGAKACVFGAPKQRDPGDLPATKAWDIAVDALRQIAPAFAAQGSALAFEANASRYNCRFVTTTAEAVRLVQEVDTAGIGLQIDTGTLFLEAEPPDVLTMAAPFAVHAHISEPDLQTLGGVDHAPIAAALRDSGYAGSLSVEMRQVEAWRSAVPAAARFVRAAYA
jgi:sugar phosphate isomerase/epimerase